MTDLAASVARAPDRIDLMDIVKRATGILGVRARERGITLAQLRGHTLRCIMPFTPAFYEDASGATGDKARVLRELFTSAEREERTRIIQRLRALGVPVEVTTR